MPNADGTPTPEELTKMKEEIKLIGEKITALRQQNALQKNDQGLGSGEYNDYTKREFDIAAINPLTARVRELGAIIAKSEKNPPKGGRRRTKRNRRGRKTRRRSGVRGVRK
jgi:hypothetical protein